MWYQCSEPGCGWTGPSHEINLSRTHLLWEDEIGWCPECQHAIRGEDRVKRSGDTAPINNPSRGGER